MGRIEKLFRKLSRGDWVWKKSEEQPEAFLHGRMRCHGKGCGVLERMRV